MADRIESETRLYEYPFIHIINNVKTTCSRRKVLEEGCSTAWRLEFSYVRK